MPEEKAIPFALNSLKAFIMRAFSPYLFAAGSAFCFPFVFVPFISPSFDQRSSFHYIRFVATRDPIWISYGLDVLQVAYQTEMP